MTTSSTAKTRSHLHHPLPVFAIRKLAGFADRTYSVEQALTQTRVTDKYGTVQADYSYDAFGSPYLGNLENDIGFGYCGKVYDVGTGLYDYGFRDYSPVSARFTTVDPIRDGDNWFTFVINDPVNYYDPDGLKVYNNSNSPVIIKPESDSGFVILASNKEYDGYNVVGYPYENNNPIDKGKIDGIIFTDGRIEKYSDADWLPASLSVSATINADYSVQKTGIESYLVNTAGDISKFAKNIIIWTKNVVTGKGVFSTSGMNEFSGTYHVKDGSKTGDWIDASPSATMLNLKLNGNSTVYVTKESLNNLAVIGNVTNGIINSIINGFWTRSLQNNSSVANNSSISKGCTK